MVSKNVLLLKTWGVYMHKIKLLMTIEAKAVYQM